MENTYLFMVGLFSLYGVVTWVAVQRLFLLALLLLLVTNVAFLSLLLARVLCDMDLMRFVSIQLGPRRGRRGSQRKR